MSEAVVRPRTPCTRWSRLAGCRWLIALALCCACEEPAPKYVKLEAPELVLSDQPVKVLVWKFDQYNAKTVGNGKYEFTVQPAELASVTKEGQLTCRQSGDGTVSVSVSGVEGSRELKCRLVDHFEAGASREIDLAKGPVDLAISAYDKDGNPLPDVPLSLTTRNTKVATIEGSRLTPLSVGDVTIKVKAGEVRKDVTISIIRELEPEALPLDDNTRIHFSLEPGRYELVVELASEKPLQMEWRGAPYCNYKKTAKTHRGDCLLRTKGGVVFDNPAYLDTGSKDVSRAGVSIREIPER